MKTVGKYSAPNAHIAIPNSQMFVTDTVDNAPPSITAIATKTNIARTVFLSVFINSRLRHIRPSK